MLDQLMHRGPDAEGLAAGPGWAIGVRRLAIIDLVSGDQPVASEDGHVQAVLNGEIYNYRELRQELVGRGHTLRSQGDSEVLVHLWEDLGPAMLGRLRGMFALALVDEGRRCLFLARDRVGKKPLYWARPEGGLVFASELKALRAALPQRPAVDPGALRAFLQWGFVPEKQCIAQGVQKLPPGSWLQLDLGSGEIRQQRYWDLRIEPRPGLGVEEAAGRLRATLDEAVRLRLRADVPLAVFLSGGLDSGVVAALAARHQADLRGALRRDGGSAERGRAGTRHGREGGRPSRGRHGLRRGQRAAARQPLHGVRRAAGGPVVSADAARGACGRAVTPRSCSTVTGGTRRSQGTRRHLAAHLRDRPRRPARGVRRGGGGRAPAAAAAAPRLGAPPVGGARGGG
ncbi:MAG: asparagine synthetase B family protein [Thermoanaerobaculaceae bacterium]